MKKLFSILALAFVFAAPAQAKFWFGVKAGLNVSKVTFDKEIIASENRAGFFVGPTAELTLPILGLGVDAALLYDNKSIKAGAETETLHYLDIPLNLKYTLGLGSSLGVFVATGPQFSFNVGGGKIFENSYSLDASDFAWNIGAGVKLFKHLQIGYNYSIPMGKTAEINTATVIGQVVKNDFKTNTHQISLAYFF